MERVDASSRSQYAYPTSKKPHKKKCGKVIAEPKELISQKVLLNVRESENL